MRGWWKTLTRRKPLNSQSTDGTKLARVLTVTDLTALGVGSTLGVGVYVLAGDVSKNTAGPAIVLSFLIAAFASVLAGLCYAEFAARVPKAGSAYIYSYVTVGEFIAFVIGWNLILEYVIGSASVSRGMSAYIDSLLNDTMKHAFMSVAPVHVTFLSSYFDFFACTICIMLSVALAFGVKESSAVNNVLTVLNITVVIFVIAVGSFRASPKNWKINRNDIPNGINGGNGGFMPFGIAGVIKGAATCFYGFIGFDCVATTGEEVKNPQRSIPLAIIFSLIIVFLSYFGISTVLTMVWPYYDQDENAPIPYVFDKLGWSVAHWVVSIGGIFGLCSSLFGAMFPLPRIIYAMATDGLVFKFLGTVHSHWRTPVVGTLLAGTMTGIMAAMFEMDQLVNMMSIGTLLAYTVVAACVLLLRYKSEANSEDGYHLISSYENSQVVKEMEDSDDDVVVYSVVPQEDLSNNECLASSTDELLHKEKHTWSDIVCQIINSPKAKNSNALSSKVVTIELLIFCILTITTSLSFIFFLDELINGHIITTAVVTFSVLMMVLILISISIQPQSSFSLPFKVPFVPFVPAISISFNVHLMLMLDFNTWIRFTVWMVLGLSVYFGYSICHSTERKDYESTELSVSNKKTCKRKTYSST